MSLLLVVIKKKTTTSQVYRKEKVSHQQRVEENAVLTEEKSKGTLKQMSYSYNDSGWCSWWCHHGVWLLGTNRVSSKLHIAQCSVVCDHLHPFKTTADNILMATSREKLQIFLKKVFLNMEMSSLLSIGLQSHQISIL